MEKIKILFYSHTIDYAGTWRSHERVLLNLNKDIFDVYVFYNTNQDNNRLDYLKTQMDIDKIILFYASNDKLGPEYGYPYKETNFSELAKKYNFDIIHFARSGYYEWPFVERICPIQIETNIFGFKDNSIYLDYSAAVSETMKNYSNSNCVIYNPIPNKINNNDSLREELNIPDDYFIFGRIGRPANFTPIALKALGLLKPYYNKFKFIIIGACEDTKTIIQQQNLQDNCIIINTTNDDYYIHKFNNTIDIFLHYRSDGETFGTAIAQSMMYGKPVISHYGGYNAQSEIIYNGGIVCNNEYEYFNYIKLLIENKETYNQLSQNAIKRAENFCEENIVKQWENTYINLKNKINK